eukprot:88157_1
MELVLENERKLCVYGFIRMSCSTYHIPGDLKALCLSIYLILFDEYFTLQHRIIPSKWCQMINFLIQMHYDLNIQPKAMSFAAEYLSYLANRGLFNEILNSDTSCATNDNDIRYNCNIRMALSTAFQHTTLPKTNFDPLFDMNRYPEPLMFSNHKQDQSTASDDDNTYTTNTAVVDLPRRKETDLFFSFSNRYETLQIYLKRIGFRANHVIYQPYNRIKRKYNQHLIGNDNELRSRDAFSDHTKFGFLCQYLLEITYYQPEFYSFSQCNVVIGVIYSAFVIARRWRRKFKASHLCYTKQCLYEILDNTHPIKNVVICEIIRKVIEMAGSPYRCHVLGLHHSCDCLLNCYLNTYLKYSKVGFCGIAKIPMNVSYDVNKNIHKFVNWYDTKQKRRTAKQCNVMDVVINDAVNLIDELVLSV